jgi:phage regulator Rha-like protein
VEDWRSKTAHNGNCERLRRSSEENRALLPIMIEITNCDLKMKKRRNAKLLRMPKRRGTPIFSVESRILFLRHQKVILDSDLAELYGVPAKRLNEQVKRNHERFPADFMFQLTGKEEQILRSQFATSKKGRGGRRYPPYAFTEHGAIMAATVLNTKQAIQMSVFVVRAFVRVREMLATNQQFAAKVDELERRLTTHDSTIQEIIEAIKELMVPEETPRRKMGFQLPAAKH